MDAGIAIGDLKKAQERFTRDEKILFDSGYVIIKNSEKYENHLSNKQLMRSALKQFCFLPENIKNIFLTFKPKGVIDAYISMFSLIGYEIDSSLQVVYNVGYSVDEVIRNKKEEVINNKKEIRNKKEEEKNKNHKNAETVLKWFNQLLGTKFTSTYGFEDNLAFWLKIYKEDDIKKALIAIQEGEWWAKDPSPTLLFRRKSPKGENVDYIGDLINKGGGNNE